MTSYGDNYVNIGAVSSSSAGKYLLTIPTEYGQAGTMSTDSGLYQGVVYAPNTIGLVLIRLLVTDPSTDVSTAQELLNEFMVNTTSRKTTVDAPELNTNLFSNTGNSQVEQVMGVTSRFMQTVPPSGESFISGSASSTLSLAGIGNGTYQKPDCVNLTEASVDASDAIKAELNSTVVSLGNNWTMPNPQLIGMYNGDYVARALIAIGGYLALTNDQAIYPSYKGNFSLEANESYTVQFSSKPPLSKLGFWSLTMYNEPGFLVENPIDRYALGDRSNLSYANGSSVYANDDDGPFSILVQRDQPPSNWSSK